MLELETQVKGKVRKAYCEAGVVAGNGLLAFVRFVLFPIRTLLADRAAADAGGGRGEGECLTAISPFTILYKQLTLISI